MSTDQILSEYPYQNGGSSRRFLFFIHNSKKAPSGRELAAEQTEGERDITTYHKAMVYAPMLHAISFRLAMLDTSLPEGGNREEQAPPLPAQRAVSAARRYIIKATPCISSRFSVDIISPTETDSATQNQLHLCKAQTSLHSNFTWHSQTSPHRQVPRTYPPQCGISSRQRLVYHHASAWISSHLGVYIISHKNSILTRARF